MKKGDEFHSPMDALELHKSGKIKLGKTLLKDDLGRTYRVIRFDYHNGQFVMFLEFPDKSHQPIDKHKIALMKLEIVPDTGIQRTDWEDPP